MKLLKIQNIPIKPISVNKAYYKRNNMLTKLARECRLGLFTHLVNTKGLPEQLAAFRASFNPSKDKLLVAYTFKIPINIFYRSQDGAISMKSGDVDNYIKVLNDFLFNEKYYGDQSRYEFTTYNIGIDDRYITDIRAVKEPSLDAKWSIDVEVRIEPIVRLESL